MKTGGTSFVLHLQRNFAPIETYPSELDKRHVADGEPYASIADVLALSPRRRAAMDAKQLAAEFGVRDVVDFAEQGGLVKAVVSQGGMRGELFLQGATVTAWQPAGERPVIFTSPNAIFAPGTAVRGGVPIIFPWFGPKRDEPKAPQHGFVRAL